MNQKLFNRRRISKVFIVTLAIMAVAAVGGVSAYFTATDQKDNTWTVGNVNIQLEEPEYDAAEGERDAIVPNMSLKKDPQILNDGNNDAFVFMKVSIPKANVKVATDDNSSFIEAVQELFDYSFDGDWAVINTTEGEDSNTYVCVYGTKGRCEALPPGDTTSTLFKDGSIRFKNVLEGQHSIDGVTLNMPVEAFAIQADNITEDDTDVPSEVWNILKK